MKTIDELRNELIEKQQRMNHMKGVMADSDNHAKKAKKLEIDFGETYPDDIQDYTAANAEYHRIESEVAELEAEIERREQEEEESRNIE